MGVVYRAKQVSIDRVVAIKMMHARAAQDPQWVDRFHSEAKACSLLTHPNTVRLYDFGQTTLGNLYMVMEFLEGRSLQEVIEQESPMPAARVLRILMQCSASLSEAHAAGVIHRDIKPENIIVRDLAGATDFIKLFDFSIAKRADHAMTVAGMVFGTPQFMSPEQARGKEIDHRSDLYSLGVVAYAMLSATLPFHHQDAIEILKMHQSAEVPPLPDYVPSSVARVVMACLEKQPSRRPASALALLEASKVWLTQLDPTLDVASDPVLKNTLITKGHPADSDVQDHLVTENLPVQAPPQATPPPRVSASANGRTLLSASGASNLNKAWDNTKRSPSPEAQSSGTASSHGRHASEGHDAAAPSSGTHTPPGSAAATQHQPAEGEASGARPLAASPRSTQLAAIHYAEAAGQISGYQFPVITGTPDSAEPAPVRPQVGPAPHAQALEFATPLPSPQRNGTGAFVLLCVLVAATFGAGGYYLTTMLR